jgi:hypothetical protein
MGLRRAQVNLPGQMLSTGLVVQHNAIPSRYRFCIFDLQWGGKGDRLAAGLLWCAYRVPKEVL